MEFQFTAKFNGRSRCWECATTIGAFSGSPFYAGVVKSQYSSSHSLFEGRVKLTLDIHFCTDL